jgi:hypothetical protein
MSRYLSVNSLWRSFSKKNRGWNIKYLPYADFQRIGENVFEKPVKKRKKYCLFSIPIKIRPFQAFAVKS